MGLSLAAFTQKWRTSITLITSQPERRIYFDRSYLRPDKQKWYINGNLASRDEVERDMTKCNMVFAREVPSGVGPGKFADVVMASIDQMDVLFRLCDGILEAHQTSERSERVGERP